MWKQREWILNKEIEEAIEKAKKIAIKSYEGKEMTERRWLVHHVDSYENPHNRVSFFVLEGSPPKAVVYVNYGHRFILVINAWGKVIKKIFHITS